MLDINLSNAICPTCGKQVSLGVISKYFWHGTNYYTECNHCGQRIHPLKEPVSMYEPIYNDGGDTIYLYDQIAVKEDEYGLDNRLALDRAMKNLKKRELNILKDRFIVGKTQMEIAEELGISQAQISRIEKNAINTIKKNIK